MFGVIYFLLGAALVSLLAGYNIWFVVCFTASFIIQMILLWVRRR